MYSLSGKWKCCIYSCNMGMSDLPDMYSYNKRMNPTDITEN